MIVFLVGMPGSGKTAIGAALSSETGMPLLDTDAAIEKKFGKSVSEIFAENGEEFFRQEEKDLIQYLAADKLIVATGGGTPVFGELMSCMKQLGIVVYLYTSTKFLAERLAGDTTRPLLQGENQLDTIEELYASRKSIYEEAHHTIAIDGKSVTELVAEIRSLLT